MSSRRIDYAGNLSSEYVSENGAGVEAWNRCSWVSSANWSPRPEMKADTFVAATSVAG